MRVSTDGGAGAARGLGCRRPARGARQLAPPGASPFASLSVTPPIEPIGGGYETDVFRSGDGRLALKLKATAGSRAGALARARRLADVADLFRRYLGPDYSLPSAFLVVAAAGGCRVLAVQPFLGGARALDAVDHASLAPAARAAVAGQLAAIAARALACYRDTGYLPDLYGLSAHDAALARRWDPRWAVREARRILLGCPLLRAHNLLLTGGGRVVLVDYDPVCDGRGACRLLYGVRAALLRRDRRHVAALASG